MNKTIESLNLVDDVLRRLEDYTHGQEGRDITNARKLIEQSITEISLASSIVSEDEILKEARKLESTYKDEEGHLSEESAGAYHGFIQGAKWSRDKSLNPSGGSEPKKWIFISKKLPDLGVPVLVLSKDKTQFVGQINDVTNIDREYGNYYWFDSKGNKLQYISDTLAYQYLPFPLNK